MYGKTRKYAGFRLNFIIIYQTIKITSKSDASA